MMRMHAHVEGKNRHRGLPEGERWEEGDQEKYWALNFIPG